MRTNRKRPTAGASAAVLAMGLVLAGCADGGVDPAPAEPAAGAEWAGGDTNAAALDELYQTALDAGESEVYLYGLYNDLFAPVWEKFESRFPGLYVTGEVLAGANLEAKISAEFSTGNRVGDMYIVGLAGLISQVNADRAESFVPITADELDPRYKGPEDKFFVSFGDPYGVYYNTTKVSDSEVPESVEDLLDPKWEGSLMLDNPTTTGIAQLTWIELWNSGIIDEQWMEDIAPNLGIITTGSMVSNTTLIDTGEVGIAPWAGWSRYAAAKEAGAANIAFKAIPGFSAFLAGGSLIFKDAPNANAAKLLQSYLFTPEAQAAIIETHNVPVMPGITLPAGTPDPAVLTGAFDPISPTDYPSKLGELATILNRIYG